MLTPYGDTVRQCCQDAIHSHFAVTVRSALQSLLNAFLEHERDTFLGCDPYQRTQRRTGYRNGCEERYFETIVGPVRVRMPRVRQSREPFRPLAISLYQRRQPKIDRTIVEMVARGLSTRQAARVLERCFDTVVSPATISNVVARVDRMVQAFHSRPLERGYRWLYLDAKHCYVSHRRKRRGRGKKKKAVVLLAFGVRHDGISELVDFRIADCESYEHWSGFLSDLEARGVKRRDRHGRELEMNVTDGDMGLLEALALVWPTVPSQRCIFHKVQNIADHLRDRSWRQAILSTAAGIYDGLTGRRQAEARLRRWAQDWGEHEPEAVQNFQMEFDRTLTYLNAPAQQRRRLKTNNVIERFIEELNRKIKQTRVFVNEASLERAVFITWQKLQADGYPETAPDHQNLFTRNS